MCGLIGIVNDAEASAHAVEGLYAQQHRGHEAAGIASSDGTDLFLVGAVGLVGDVFSEERNVPAELPGSMAIGHCRYSTNAKGAAFQPIPGTYCGEPFCLAHNGNLTNKDALAQKLGDSALRELVDTALIVRLLEAQSSGDFEEDLVHVLSLLSGSYCLLILIGGRLYAVRDPSGCHPLVTGENDRLFAFASETCAFETLRVRHLGEVAPGTFVRIGPDRARTTHTFAAPRLKFCSFEPIYISLLTGETFGIPLNDLHMRIGRALEEECPADADIVVGVPDSANIFAVAYGSSGRSGRYTPGALIRHHNAGGRTFILPTEDKRAAGVRRKFQFSTLTVRGKRMVIVDDSIVRGTTMRALIEQAYAAGATEVHVRIAYSVIAHSCFYGVDTPDKRTLLGHRFSLEAMRGFLNATSLGFLPKPRLLRELGKNPEDWCTACVDGQ